MNRGLAQDMARTVGACSSTSSPPPQTFIAYVSLLSEHCSLLPSSACSSAVHVLNSVCSGVVQGTRHSYEATRWLLLSTPSSRHLHAYDQKMTFRLENSEIMILSRKFRETRHILKQGTSTLTPSMAVASLPLGGNRRGRCRGNS